MTENSSLEGDELGGDGEVGWGGATLTAGTSPVIPFAPNLIPYIWQLYQQQASMGTPVLTYSGTLAPGTYTYNVEPGGNGDINDSGSLTFSSDFQVTPVPKPVALTLLGMSAVAMPRRRLAA